MLGHSWIINVAGEDGGSCQTAASGRRDAAELRALVVENDLTSRELLARVLRLKGSKRHGDWAAQAAALLVMRRCVTTC